MKKVAVVLSGCGVMDGSEIHEAVLTLLALDEAGASYQCAAPDRVQPVVMNHVTKQAMPETRNMMIEAARIARGNIVTIESLDVNAFDALIFPGGYGAAKNLSTFAEAGEKGVILPEVKLLIEAFYRQGKPVGFICIAPTLIPMAYPSGVKATIGNDKATSEAMEHMGAEHQVCGVNACVVDAGFKVVSTPAYMLAQSIKEAAFGIRALVHEVLAQCKP